MRTFSYHHWGSELVLVGDWPALAAGETVAAGEARLCALQEALWSDSPPQLQPGPALDELLRLAHPLARALVLIYHVVGRQAAAPDHAERLRQAALAVLEQAPIAHVESAQAERVQSAGALRPPDGAYVRWAALNMLRELAQAPDFPRIAACLERAGENGSAATEPAAAAVAEEQAEAVRALAALVQREPALQATTRLEQELLALLPGDRSPPVRIAAMQVLMALYPSPQADAALRRIATDDPAGEPAWAAAIALFRSQPEAHAGLLLATMRRARRPESFDPLFTELSVCAEEAALRIALHRPDGSPAFIWREPDGSVFALCRADGSPPPGADDPRLRAIGGAWSSASEAVRARLLCALADCDHATSRALAILSGPASAEDPYDADDADAETAHDPAAVNAAGPAGPSFAVPESASQEVDFLALARAVLTDLPLTRLVAQDVDAGRALHSVSDANAANNANDANKASNVDAAHAVHDRSTSPSGALALPARLTASNHCAALKMLGEQGMPGDGAVLVRTFLLARQPDNPVCVAALKSLHVHGMRWGQLPADPELLSCVIALARTGEGEARREAVELLGCWPAELTAAVLRELAQDPTYSVCCLADRALTAQAFAAGQEPAGFSSDVS